MEYRPRYSQPFTLEEARQLAVPIITEEISRLQNSLTHLHRTQDELQDALSTSAGDADLSQAFEENEVVIGSQKERITMLRMVLAEKGVPMSAHYDVPQRARANAPGAHARPEEAQTQASTTENGAPSTNGNSVGVDADEGVYL
ncbi:hypothetical protein GY45DRAFT_1342497 [Cubamyces sp. BRFM 1775]|nr:hypothetical protein GY45DRAFT_1342497 [Cubamyces sp. BRFM 1775]